MEADWIMVRIKRSTRARLEATRQSMLLAADVGLRNVELDNRDRFSLDQVIGILLDMRDRHAERRKRSAAGRRRRKRSAGEDDDQAGSAATMVLLVDKGSAGEVSRLE